MKVLAAFFQRRYKHMKNELQQHKKSDSVKWIVVFILIAILAISMVGLMVKTSTDLFPSDEVEGNNEEMPGVEETPECEHVFEYGICTECNERAIDLISHATKAISADEDCIVNYYDDHLNLIKSETVKGGDNFVGFEGYTEYIALYPSEMNVPNLDNVKDGDILMNGKLWTKDSSYDNSFLDLYPRYVQNYGMFRLNLEIDDFYGVYNDKPIFQFGLDNDFMYSAADGFGFYLKEGDRFNILYGSDGAHHCHGFVTDGIIFNYFTMDNVINLKYDIDVVNVIVIGYDSGEVA